MNHSYRYILEKGSKKFCCPSCNKKTFVRYVDTEDNNNYLPFNYGRCDRQSNCSYNLSPYKDQYLMNNYSQPQQVKKVNNMKLHKEVIFYPKEILNQTLNSYNENIFIQNLLSNVNFPFKLSDIEKIISMYYLGTVKKGYRKGAITFPFIDINNNIRTIQAKQFNNDNKTISTDFIHKIIEKHYIKNNHTIPQWITKYNDNELKVSCLFGEHLLRMYPDNPIALVEAPKTAIYGTLYFGFPSDYKKILWLAVYNLSSLNFQKCKVLQGRKVFLFPDLSKNGLAYNLWKNKAFELNQQITKTKFIVSDLLEKHATIKDCEDGKDLADFLISKDWQQFRINSNT